MKGPARGSLDWPGQRIGPFVLCEKFGAEELPRARFLGGRER